VVHLLGSAEALLRAESTGGEEYTSTRDLMARMERWVRAHPAGAVVHAAAVGDYEMAEVEGSKIPSGSEEIVLRLRRTPKIADRVRSWAHTGPYVTFKAAAPHTSADELVDIASRQRARVGCDMVFANVLGRLTTGVYLVGDDVRRFELRSDGIEALVGWLDDALERRTVVDR
jgi:phosphopantothenoylcysteine synthetase/decarboxylase